ncbi:MAG: elongation factor Ts [Pirellulaceae bacterium]|jgi:elongation factor Ts
MSEISASAVMSLRKSTGLPMMDCKKALSECNGDADAAVAWLRDRGADVLAKRSDRETTFGRFGLHVGASGAVGAMVELKCESAPVAGNEEFVQLANDLAQQLATGPGAETADELLSQPSPSKDGQTLGAQKDELFNRIREVFNVGRMTRIEGATGGYSHNASTISGVIIEIEGGSDELARDVCMHIAAMSPEALSSDDLNQEDVARERAALRETALREGKPENIVDKMVEGRLRNYFAERCLLSQAFVKDDKQAVGQVADAAGMKICQFVHWELGKE